jgi:hypothetical protein
MATKRFDKRLHVLVSAAESAMLDELAEHDGLTPSDVVRQLIRKRHTDVFGATAKHPTSTTRKRTR